MAVQKVELTDIKRMQKTSKRTGKDYTRVLIKTKQHGDKTLSGFGNYKNEDWEVGDTVSIVTEKVKKNGNVYLNFEVPENATKEQSEPSAAEYARQNNFFLKNKLKPAMAKLLDAKEEQRQALRELQNTVEAIYESQVEQPKDEFQEEDDITSPFDDNNIGDF